MSETLLTDPPLLEGEVEIDLTDCYDPDPLATVRGDAASVQTRIRIERMIAARKLANGQR